MIEEMEARSALQMAGPARPPGRRTVFVSATRTAFRTSLRRPVSHRDLCPRCDEVRTTAKHCLFPSFRGACQDEPGAPARPLGPPFSHPAERIRFETPGGRPYLSILPAHCPCLAWCRRTWTWGR